MQQEYRRSIALNNRFAIEAIAHGLKAPADWQDQNTKILAKEGDSHLSTTHHDWIFQRLMQSACLYGIGSGSLRRARRLHSLQE
jgi:hypothetical protein